MKQALIVALFVSLAANLWLAWSAQRPPNPVAPPETKAGGGAVVASTPSAALANVAPAVADASTRSSSGVMWRELRTEDDYRRMADELRAAGFPAHLVYRVLQDVYDQKLRLESPIVKTPFWQRRSVASSAAAQEHEKQREARVEALFPGVARAEKVDPSWRVRRYGDLSDEKIAAISAVERDYSEMRRSLPSPFQGGRVSADAMTARLQQNELLEAELRADLAKVLTPAELEAYELRSSKSAQTTARMLQDVTLTADEFAALSHAREAYDAIMTQRNSPSGGGDLMRRQGEAQTAYVEQLRATLTDERFYTALEGFDSTYRAVAALGTRFPSVTPAKAYEAMQVRDQMRLALSSLAASGPTRDGIEAEFSRWNARLDTVLGTEAATAFRQTRTGQEFLSPGMRRANPPALPPRG